VLRDAGRVNSWLIIVLGEMRARGVRKDRLQKIERSMIV